MQDCKHIPARGLVSAGLIAFICATATAAPSQFAVDFDAGAIVSLKHAEDPDGIQYIAYGQRLGDIVIRYRHQDGDWQTIGESARLVTESRFETRPDVLRWTLRTRKDITSAKSHLLPMYGTWQMRRP